jgi:hypothetical protein
MIGEASALEVLVAARSLEDFRYSNFRWNQATLTESADENSWYFLEPAANQKAD